MAKFDTTGYLVVKISDPLNEKNIGPKCIPARWAENALRDNYLIIRYPEEDNSETRGQVKNKEPPKNTWPFYCALVMFRTDSYEKAIEFITENDKQDSPAAADEQPDNTMNETNASASATPSTSRKRTQSEENDKNSTDEDNLPKKKRESAIRSGNNLKMLIQNKLLHYFPKQKVSPQKVVYLRKEAQTNSPETLVSIGKINKVESLYSKTVTSEPFGSTINDETVAVDDSDSNNENSETIPPSYRNILEPVSKIEPNTNDTTTNPERSKTPLRETVIATDDSDSNNEPDTIPLPDRNILTTNKQNNTTNTTINPGRSTTPLPEIVDSDPTQISSTNNLDQHKESKNNFKGFQYSLNAEVSALQNLIHRLSPENENEHQNTSDIKHIEDIYNSILEVKKKMNAVFTEKSIQLKTAFESINLFVPEIKKGLFLPTIEQIKENSQPTNGETKRLSSRQDTCQRKGPSSHPRTPSLQQWESSSDSESFSQSSKPSTSSESYSYVAK